MCGASDICATHRSLTLTLSRQRERELGQSARDLKDKSKEIGAADDLLFPRTSSNRRPFDSLRSLRAGSAPHLSFVSHTRKRETHGGFRIRIFSLRAIARPSGDDAVGEAGYVVGHYQEIA